MKVFGIAISIIAMLIVMPFVLPSGGVSVAWLGSGSGSLAGILDGTGRTILSGVVILALLGIAFGAVIALFR